MLRLQGARLVAAAATTALRTSSLATAAPLQQWRSVALHAASVPAMNVAAVTASCRFTCTTTTAAPAVSITTPHTCSAAKACHGSFFLRSARVAALGSSSSACVAQARAFRVKGQEKASGEEDNSQQKQQAGEEAKPKEEEENGEEKAKAEGEEDAKASGKGKKKRAAPKKKSFMDHIRGLREDYAKFPDIYNSANAINFVVFTVFCLCSTGSNSEENWWMTQWGLDNSFRPWTWFLHSFLTNNFLSMTYAMMLLHTMCHHVLPTLGSRGLMMYCGSAAVISGAIMWLGNYLYYGSTAAPEKQFGPWDIVAALFVMEYFYYGLTPLTILNSFSGWIKYAVWVGEICILYFDWQPTFVGTLVGLALCKGVPRFRAVKPAAAAGM